MGYQIKSIFLSEFIWKSSLQTNLFNGVSLTLVKEETATLSKSCEWHVGWSAENLVPAYDANRSKCCQNAASLLRTSTDAEHFLQTQLQFRLNNEPNAKYPKKCNAVKIMFTSNSFTLLDLRHCLQMRFSSQASDFETRRFFSERRALLREQTDSFLDFLGRSNWTKKIKLN